MKLFAVITALASVSAIRMAHMGAKHPKESEIPNKNMIKLAATIETQRSEDVGADMFHWIWTEAAPDDALTWDEMKVRLADIAE